MLRRRMLCAALAASAIAAGCAAGSTSGATKMEVAPQAQHPAEWYTLAAGRADYQKSAHDFDVEAGDCTLACKALASLERAADHLCAVAEPEECTDARARVDRAKRAVNMQCGGC